jgi:hypothetical protein
MMKITIRHPAFVRAKTKGGRVARPSVILPQAEFNIHDLDSRQAPVAFTVTKTTYGSPPLVREVRAFNDGLYVTVRKENSYSQSEGPETLDELVAALSSGPLNRKGFMVPLVEKMRSATRGVAEGETVYPSGIYNALAYTELPDDHDLVVAAIKLTDLIAIDDEVRADVAAWHAITQRYIDNLISVDGLIYRRCGEPVYELHQSVYSANLEVHYLEAWQANGPTTQITFAATSTVQAQEALVVARTRVDPDKQLAGDRNNELHIEVADESYVRWRAEERDFDHFARGFERTLNTGIDDLRLRRDTIIPRSVYDAWLDLRDLLGSYDKLTGVVPEELEGVLSVTIEIWRGFQERLGNEICSKQAPSIGVVDTMFQRFADRPIDMGPVVGLQRPTFKP